MPPPFVKKTGQVIHYYYAKLVIAPSAGLAGNYRFIIERYKALESGEIQMSNYNRELWLKETEPQSTCAYCGGPGPLVADHVIPRAASGPDAMHNILRVCADCNSTKGDRDLIEWWEAVQARRIGDASEALPRLAAGIYLKIAYDWHRVQNTLESPARSLGDLRPFMPAGRASRSQVSRFKGEASPSPQTPSRTGGVLPSKPEKGVSRREPTTESSSRGIIDLVLGRYLYKEDVQQLLEEMGVLSSGTKDELIDRLVQDSRFDPKKALAFIDRQGLSSLCEELGLPTGGFLRGSLEDRILAAILTERRAGG